MKKRLIFGVAVLAMLLSACGGKEKSSNTSVVKTSTSKEPAKSVNNLSISLGNSEGKSYITVTGTQVNYTAETFKWAWGLKADDGTFDDGKAIPSASDFTTATFNSDNQFTVRYCLTDIESLRAGTLYRVYGGTPETYNEIPFASNMFGANDGTRKYYLRQDQENALIFDSIQPLTYTIATIEEIAEADLPAGVTQAGAYLKIGGANSKNLTLETLNAWNEAGKIAGDFQRVIPSDSYSQHIHEDGERFYTIEGNNVYFYLYCGFIAEGEGWMVHFDLVSGSLSAGLYTSNKFNGSPAYTIGGATFKIYSDSDKSGESNYWGCLGVYREATQA